MTTTTLDVVSCAKQRATETTGLVLMGVRVYNPVTDQFTSVDPVYGGNTTVYAYPDDPINRFDLDGQLSCGKLKKACKAVGKVAKKATSVKNGVKNAALQTGQLVPYGVYYASWRALKYSKYMPTPVRAGLIAAQAGGLAGDTVYDVLRGKSIRDDGRRDSVLPQFIKSRYDPKWAYTYLPGIDKDWHVDFRW